MGSLVQLGDVPAWISTATGAAGLYLGVRNRKQAQALDWAQVLQELAGLTEPELRHVVEDNPVIAQMVDLAWEEAARTASEDKRRLLAQVVAAALRGDENTTIDDLQFLMRTVMALDPAHVTLLVVIAMPHSSHRSVTGFDRPKEGVERGEMLGRWQGGQALLDAALAALDREGLIVGMGEYTQMNDEKRWWALGPYGKLFFRFLMRSGEADLWQS
jgi:hypothetical protein